MPAPKVPCLLLETAEVCSISPTSVGTEMRSHSLCLPCFSPFPKPSRSLPLSLFLPFPLSFLILTFGCGVLEAAQPNSFTDHSKNGPHLGSYVPIGPESKSREHLCFVVVSTFLCPELWGDVLTAAKKLKKKNSGQNIFVAWVSSHWSPKNTFRGKNRLHVYFDLSVT